MTPLRDALTTALFHSLWQIAAIASCLWVALVLLRRNSADLRYGVACGSLAAMLVVPALTMAVAYEPTRSSEVDTVTLTRTLRAVATPAGSLEIAADAARPRESVSALATIRHWAFPVWIAGVLVLSARLAAAGVHATSLTRVAGRVDTESETIFMDLVHRMGDVQRRVSLAISESVSGPATVGWIRPVILLPPAAMLGVSPQQLEALLAHELAHIRRHDYLVNVCQMVIETLLFYHPAVWWVSARIRSEREVCCDDIVLQTCGDRHDYARALARIAHLDGSRTGLAMGAASGALLDRIRRILAGPPTASAPWSTVCVVAVIVAGALALANAQARIPGTINPQPTRDTVVRGRVLEIGTAIAIPDIWVRAWHVTGIPVPNRLTSPIVETDRESGSPGHPVYWTRTSADGRFEIRGLTPGEYLVSAGGGDYLTRHFGQTADNMPETSVVIAPGATVGGVDLQVVRAGSVSGKILDEDGDGIPGIEVELLQRRYLPGGARPVAVLFAQSERDGEFRLGRVPPGEYLLRAYASGGLRPKRSDGSTYGATYFPSTTDSGAAQFLNVGSGQTLSRLDLQLALVRTRQVSGKLIDPTGQSFAGTRVQLLSPSVELGQLVSVVDADGRFRVTSVPPGVYTVVVNDPAERRRWNGTEIEVTGESDLSDVTIAANPGVGIRGRITVEGGGSLDPSELGVTLQQGSAVRGFRVDAGALAIAKDGTFSLDSAPGEVAVHVSRVPTGWFVKSVTMDGNDVTDQTFELAPDTAVRQMDIRLSRRGGTLRGAVHERSGRPVSSAVVVIFPADRGRWSTGRLMRTTFSHQQGRFDFGAVPPADYRAVAVASLPRGAWTDPVILDRLWSNSVAVSLDEGQERDLTLELAPTPTDLFQ